MSQLTFAVTKKSALKSTPRQPQRQLIFDSIHGHLPFPQARSYTVNGFANTLSTLLISVTYPDTNQWAAQHNGLFTRTEYLSLDLCASRRHVKASVRKRI